MTRPLTVVMAFAVAATAASPIAGEIVHHPDYTVDTRGDLTMILWFSEGVLNASEPPEGFPAEWWPAAERQGTCLAERFWRRTGDTGCLPLPQGEVVFIASPEDQRPPPTDYATFLSSSELVVVAEVQKVEPGLLVLGEGGIAQRVYLSVVEVLRGPGGSVAPGDDLNYIGPGGNLHLGGGIVCGLERPEQRVPEPRTQVILSASTPEPESGTFVNASTVFPVQNGSVILTPGTWLTDQEVPLEELRAAMIRVREEED